MTSDSETYSYPSNLKPYKHFSHVRTIIKENPEIKSDLKVKRQ